MGRARVRACLVALLVGAALLAGCDGGSGVPVVSLSSLATRQERYDGTRVQVEGHVRPFVDADGQQYYVLEDAGHDRVQLEPSGAARSYRGTTVRVRGCFTADPSTGRHLQVTAIARLVDGATHQARTLPAHACRAAGGPTA